MEILWFVVVGIIAGWLAGVLMKGRGFGLVGDLIVGVLGAVIGGMLFDFMGITAYGTLGAIAMAVIGALILLGLAGMVRKTA